MNTESQNIEFKESWRDEYQKWICGFANAQGGVLYVGVKDTRVRDKKKQEANMKKIGNLAGILYIYG